MHVKKMTKLYFINQLFRALVALCYVNAAKLEGHFPESPSFYSSL